MQYRAALLLYPWIHNRKMKVFGHGGQSSVVVIIQSFKNSYYEEYAY